MSRCRTGRKNSACSINDNSFSWLAMLALRASPHAGFNSFHPANIKFSSVSATWTALKNSGWVLGPQNAPRRRASAAYAFFRSGLAKYRAPRLHLTTRTVFCISLAIWSTPSRYSRSLPCVAGLSPQLHPALLTKMNSSRSRGHGPKETTACSWIRRAISAGKLASSVTKNRLQMSCPRAAT